MRGPGTNGGPRGPRRPPLCSLPPFARERGVARAGGVSYPFGPLVCAQRGTGKGESARNSPPPFPALPHPFTRTGAHAGSPPLLSAPPLPFTRMGDHAGSPTPLATYPRLRANPERRPHLRSDHERRGAECEGGRANGCTHEWGVRAAVERGAPRKREEGPPPRATVLLQTVCRAGGTCERVGATREPAAATHEQAGGTREQAAATHEQAGGHARTGGGHTRTGGRHARTGGGHTRTGGGARANRRRPHTNRRGARVNRRGPHAIRRGARTNGRSAPHQRGTPGGAARETEEGRAPPL
ncbi:hypothetical protein EDB83DRAFT_2616682 [Lactarius deliciosus]|nr:hypothetical protein EDB83DRAFT_2616682 [Lactarius deliciosus]